MRVELTVREFCHVLRANVLEEPEDGEALVLLLRILDWFIDRDPSDYEFQRLLVARMGDPDPDKDTSRRVCRFIFEEWRSRDLTRPAWERERILRARGRATAPVPYADRASIDRWARRRRRGV
jgi:hypothetical protein